MPNQYLCSGYNICLMLPMLMEFSRTSQIWFLTVSILGVSLTDEQSLKLVNGPSICAGRVEVFHNGEWKTMCDDSWDTRKAQVVCRQLNCGTALAAPGNAYYGPGNGSILLHNLICSGKESSINNCTLQPWEKLGCYHYEDASAVCSEHLPKPKIEVSTMNYSSELNITCIVYKFYINYTVYLKDMQTNRTLGNVSVVKRKYVNSFFTNASEAAQYACQYELTVKNKTFMSPLSDSVNIVGVTATTTVKPTDQATTAPGQSANNDIVTAISLVAAFTVVLLVFLAVFVVYRRKRTPLTNHDPSQGNEYVSYDGAPEKTNGTQKKARNEKIPIDILPATPNPPISNTNEQHNYEAPNEDANSGIYEIVIDFQENGGPYEMLDKDKVSRDDYHTLHR
ncbi:uncharacterized protein O3C94_013374 isoform 2-T2 [Discoglossus pictus]